MTTPQADFKPENGRRPRAARRLSPTTGTTQERILMFRTRSPPARTSTGRLSVGTQHPHRPIRTRRQKACNDPGLRHMEALRDVVLLADLAEHIAALRLGIRHN